MKGSVCVFLVWKSPICVFESALQHRDVDGASQRVGSTLNPHLSSLQFAYNKIVFILNYH